MIAKNPGGFHDNASAFIPGGNGPYITADGSGTHGIPLCLKMILAVFVVQPLADRAAQGRKSAAEYRRQTDAVIAG